MCSDRLKFCESQMERGRINEQVKVEIISTLAHTHAGSGEVATVGWWLFLNAKYTADDNSIILVSCLFRPLFSPSFNRWKASTFSANWPAVIWIKHWFYPKFSRSVRCLFGNHVHVSSQRNAEREEDEGMKMRDNAKNPKRREDDIETQGGRQMGRRERRRTQGDKKTEQGIQQAAIKTEKKEKEERLSGGWEGTHAELKGEGVFFWSAVFKSLFTFTHCPTPATAHLCKSPALASSQHHQRDITANQAGTHVQILLPLKY